MVCGASWAGDSGQAAGVGVDSINRAGSRSRTCCHHWEPARGPPSRSAVLAAFERREVWTWNERTGG